MSDNWQQNYDSCKNYAQEINQKISEYKKQPNGSTERARISATIRTMMREFTKDIDKLSNSLTIESRNNVITAREANRRRTLVDEIKQIKDDIQKQMNEGYNTSEQNNRKDPRLIPITERDDMKNISNDELLTVRSDLRQNNDRAIEALHEAVKRQKELGHAMNTEIDRHNEIIDTITEEAGLLEGRVKRETFLTKRIDRKSSALWLWVIIILLLIAIVIIAAVPFH